ncbi:MAG TPA: sulfotransferase [Solimonas sp.]|nr:sulfotransferase [Solimonas sp.]
MATLATNTPEIAATQPATASVTGLHPRIRRWLFVTGAPRSATTFVGQVLSTGPRVDYLHEPFNPDCGIAGVDQPFLYLESGDARERQLRPAVERLLRFREPLRTGYYPEDGWARRAIKRVVGSRGPFNLRIARLNPLSDTAVIKDPIGCLLADYLLQSFGIRPIIIVRNPLGFVASMRRVNWEPALAPLLAQERLAVRYYRDEDLAAIERYAGGNVIQRTALLWRLVYRVLLEMAAKDSRMLVCRHEDLSAAPLPQFARIFEHAGLACTPAVQRRIRRLTSGGHVEAPPRRVHEFRRDSAAIHTYARRALGAGDIAQIAEITAAVAVLQYAPAEFGA